MNPENPAPLRVELLDLSHSIQEAVPTIQNDAPYQRFLERVSVILEGTAVVLALLIHVLDGNQRRAVLSLIDHLLESLSKQTLVFVREL